MVLGRRGDIKAHESALEAFANNHQHPDVVTGTKPGMASRLVFMFSGQASLKEHSIKGIKDLCAHFPAFDTAFQSICHELDPHLETPLSEVIRDDLEDLVKRTDLPQAAIFALEVSTFRLLESFDVHPDAVVGHSVGEIAAAHVAGYLSLSGAASLITTWGKLMTALPGGQGVMASISASEEDVAKARGELTGRDGAYTITAVNSDRSFVVSGSVDAVTAVMDSFAIQGHPVSLLKGVHHVFHSPLMDAILGNLSQALHKDSVFCNTATELKKIPTSLYRHGQTRRRLPVRLARTLDQPSVSHGLLCRRGQHADHYRRFHLSRK